MASRECTARWERLLPEMSPEPVIRLQAGPIAAAICGSLGAMASMSAAIRAGSTTFGSSILPRSYGPGWAEAARYHRDQTMASRECTVRWERLLPEISPAPVIWLQAGSIAAAISGSLEA